MSGFDSLRWPTRDQPLLAATTSHVTTVRSRTFSPSSSSPRPAPRMPPSRSTRTDHGPRGLDTASIRRFSREPLPSSRSARRGRDDARPCQSLDRLASLARSALSPHSTRAAARFDPDQFVLEGAVAAITCSGAPGRRRVPQCEPRLRSAPHRPQRGVPRALVYFLDRSLSRAHAQFVMTKPVEKDSAFSSAHSNTEPLTAVYGVTRVID